MLAANNSFVLPVLIGSFLVLASCSSGRKTNGLLPQVGATRFSNPTAITNPWFPLTPGTTTTYLIEDGEDRETVVVEVLTTTRTVMGIACVVVRDRVYSGGLVIEDTYDWYAQDDAGNVWYMGEEVDNYNYENGVLQSITHEGSWQAGLDVANVGEIAQPGFIMPASPTPGLSNYQEYYRTAAEDMGFVVTTGLTIAVGERTFTGCVQTLDWNPLEPDTVEYKYYAPGIGLVMEHVALDTEEVNVIVGSSLLP